MNEMKYRISYEPQAGMRMAYCLEKKHKLFGLIPYWVYVPHSWFATYEEAFTFYQEIRDFDKKPKVFYL